MVLCHFFADGRPCRTDCEFAHGASELGTLKKGSGPEEDPPWVGASGQAATEKLEKQIPRAIGWRVVAVEEGWCTWNWWQRSADGGWELETSVTKNSKTEPVGGGPKTV